MDERLPSPLVVHTHQVQHDRPSSHQQPRHSRSLKPSTPMYSMRTSMPHFVSSLRVVDDWKRQHAKRAELITRAEYDVSAKFVKSAIARSDRVEDLVRFVDDTALDIDFMVQLPSIEKCLEQWWRMYAHETKSVDQDQLHTVFYDLATVLVEAKTENVHKNSVSMIVRAAWTKWGAKEPPLTKPEFFRLLFVLAHLMTASNRLNDYVVFLQETLARITRVQQSKAAHSAIRLNRKPRSRRKLSVVEIMMGGRQGGPVIVPLALASQGSSGKSDWLLSGTSDGSTTTTTKKVTSLSTAVPLPAVPVSDAGDLFDDAVEPLAPDRFVEVLERRSRCQHIVVDPLLHEDAFQRKWQRASGDATKSLNAIAIERNPVTSVFAPPMTIHHLRSSRSTTSIDIHSSSALGLDMDDSKAVAGSFTAGEDEILRRSLSRVTLKDRVVRKKLAVASPLRHVDATSSPFTRRTQQKDGSSSNNARVRESNKQPVYLAIFT